jgi:hypothetical protein
VTLSVLKECPKLGSEECKFILYEWQEQCEIGQVAGGGGDSDKSERATVGLAMTPAAILANEPAMKASLAAASCLNGAKESVGCFYATGKYCWGV